VGEEHVSGTHIVSGRIVGRDVPGRMNFASAQGGSGWQMRRAAEIGDPASDGQHTDI